MHGVGSERFRRREFYVQINMQEREITVKVV